VIQMKIILLPMELNHQQQQQQQQINTIFTKKKQMGRPKKSDIQKHQKITPKKKKREEEFTDEVADDEEYEAKDMTKSTTPSQRPPRYRKPPKIFEFDHEKIRKLSDLFQKCYSIISTIKSHPWSWPFIEPVDPVVLNLPDYFIVITKPMDLGTVSKKNFTRTI